MFRGNHAGTEVDICSGCHGLWLAPLELAAITGKPADFPQPGTATPFTCPRCNGSLQERAYGGSPDLLVECCSGCGGIYLDRGEMLMIKERSKAKE